MKTKSTTITHPIDDLPVELQPDSPLALALADRAAEVERYRALLTNNDWPATRQYHELHARLAELAEAGPIDPMVDLDKSLDQEAKIGAIRARIVRIQSAFDDEQQRQRAAAVQLQAAMGLVERYEKQIRIARAAAGQLAQEQAVYQREWRCRAAQIARDIRLCCGGLMPGDVPEPGSPPWAAVFWPEGRGYLPPEIEPTAPYLDTRNDRPPAGAAEGSAEYAAWHSAWLGRQVVRGLSG